jgi:pimeloyl-ACP methyl ester carboxylesterase
MEKVPLGGEGRYSWIYRSYSLTERNPAIERALIVVHGAGRNADSYFVSGVAGALAAGTLDRSIVISPRLASNHGDGCHDKLDAGEISWICGGGEDWRGGGAADGIAGVTTFHLIDDLVRKLAKREIFPNLRAIVITGHSAGGQFLARYAAASRVDKEIGIPVRYVVANPSNYLYLDNTRLAAGATCSEKDGCTGDFRPYAEGRNCTTYNQWRYGMEGKTGYAAAIPDEDLKKQLVSRDVTYLLGEFDTLPVYGFDSSCPAMAQGPSRLARGITYWNYLRSKYSAQHKLIVVPACGHNGRCMYTADAALPVLFPK